MPWCHAGRSGVNQSKGPFDFFRFSSTSTGLRLARAAYNMTDNRNQADKVQLLYVKRRSCESRHFTCHRAAKLSWSAVSEVIRRS